VNQEQEATGPGIVVLSPSLQVLHMNRRAMALLNQLEYTVQSIGAERAVAAPLHQHCRDIVETLKARLGSNNWEQFQQCRTCCKYPYFYPITVVIPPRLKLWQGSFRMGKLKFYRKFCFDITPGHQKFGSMIGFFKYDRQIFKRRITVGNGYVEMLKVFGAVYF